MSRKETFVPGQMVWVIERDVDGNACDMSGYLFMARCGNVVILTPFINDYDWEETLQYHVDCTVEDYDTHLAVFPAVDCFSDRAACKAALESETETDTDE